MDNNKKRKINYEENPKTKELKTENNNKNLKKFYFDKNNGGKKFAQNFKTRINGELSEKFNSIESLNILIAEFFEDLWKDIKKIRENLGDYFLFLIKGSTPMRYWISSVSKLLTEKQQQIDLNSFVLNYLKISDWDSGFTIDPNLHPKNLNAIKNLLDKLIIYHLYKFRKNLINKKDLNREIIILTQKINKEWLAKDKILNKKGTKIFSELKLYKRNDYDILNKKYEKNNFNDYELYENSEEKENDNDNQILFREVIKFDNYNIPLNYREIEEGKSKIESLIKNKNKNKNINKNNKDLINEDLINEDLDEELFDSTVKEINFYNKKIKNLFITLSGESCFFISRNSAIEDFSLENYTEIEGRNSFFDLFRFQISFELFYYENREIEKNKGIEKLNPNTIGDKIIKTFGNQTYTFEDGSIIYTEKILKRTLVKSELIDIAIDKELDAKKKHFVTYKDSIIVSIQNNKDKNTIYVPMIHPKEQIRDLKAVYKINIITKDKKTEKRKFRLQFFQRLECLFGVNFDLKEIINVLKKCKLKNEKGECKDSMEDFRYFLHEVEKKYEKICKECFSESNLIGLYEENLCVIGGENMTKDKLLYTIKYKINQLVHENFLINNKSKKISKKIYHQLLINKYPNTIGNLNIFSTKNKNYNYNNDLDKFIILTNFYVYFNKFELCDLLKIINEMIITEINIDKILEKIENIYIEKLEIIKKNLNFGFELLIPVNISYDQDPKIFCSIEEINNDSNTDKEINKIYYKIQKNSEKKIIKKEDYIKSYINSIKCI